jgi:hypothetical protein
MTKAQLELLLAMADCLMHSQRVKDAVCEMKYERDFGKPEKKDDNPDHKPRILITQQEDDREIIF